ITRLGTLAGLVLLLALFLWKGTMDSFNLLIESGWSLLLLPIIWFPCLLPATEGWRLLFANHEPPRFYDALVATWIGRSVNNLLPVASIGGEIVKARLLHQWGIPGLDAIASVMVDKISQALALALWGMIGVGTLLILSTDTRLALYATLGFAVLTFCVVSFAILQRKGFFGIMAKLGGMFIDSDTWNEFSINAEQIDHRIREIYRAKGKLVCAIALRTFSLAFQTFELWLACYLLNHPIGLMEAIMLKSLTSTLSEIAFIIPNGYGIQEGAFILIGGILGIPPDIALILSIAIRIHDIIFDPSGLFALHHLEHKHLEKKQQVPSDQNP
ncbi:MAG: flippase-like domain-containing protein, partial [Gammaproteobacteria bacterium]|nr:flippase-like domain-containing protein [Gammaproteobacteria bacterium]